MTLVPLSPVPVQDRDKHGMADEDRSALTPRDSIKGHWVTRSGRTHYYFKDKSLTMVDEARKSRKLTKSLKKIRTWACW